ncbi:hypothetical protein [Dyella japonica]|uniref:CopG family transcriptional regulator n=1 Tax=Dyella japonica TaxID=231455 RepID=A0ABV2K0D1_9GAMM
MSYEDPTHLRNKVIKVRLNDDERELVAVLARMNKRQPAVLLRDLVLQGLAMFEQSNETKRAA